MVLFLIGVPIVLPVAMVVAGPALAINFLFDRFIPETLLHRVALILLGTVLGLISSPLVWLGCLFYFVPKGVSHLWREYRERRD